MRSRIVFGMGKTKEIAQETRRLGQRALIISTPGQSALAEMAADLLGDLAVGIHAKAKMHVPVSVAQAGEAAAREVRADVLVATGGGSTIGLAKAIALRLDLPILAVPTTYAGSEMTPIWGMTEGGMKRTGRDDRVLPATVLYDPALTYALPIHTSIVSGMNAIAHCVEALYSETANPLTTLMAEQGIAALGRALPVLREEPNNAGARSDALYGAWLAGSVLGAVGMALHHKLCHTLGGTFNLPHAETHAIVLPHAFAYNRAAAPDASRRAAVALGVEDAPRALFDMLGTLGAPFALRDIGMPEAGLEDVVSLALTNPYYNPAPLDADRLRALLRNAWEGRPPEA